MAFSSSQDFASDNEATLAFANIGSAQQWVPYYSDLTAASPAQSVDTLASGWGMDATIDPSLLNLRNGPCGTSVYDTPMQRP